MLESLKPLVVVLAIALIVFGLAKPLCLHFMEADDFARRRNLWLVLTCAGFAAPNLWVYAAIALPLVYWAGRVDRHPTALYLLLLLTVPPASLPIPLPLINQLFELSPYRILALALLVPAAFRIARTGGASPAGLAKVDLLVLAYGALQLVLYMPYESITNTMRRAFLYGIDTYALYFVFSRGAVTKVALRDTLASFWLACAVLVPITVFETLKGWLLYTGIPARWGVPNEFSWLFRDDSLRAQASAGHSLTMGYLFAIAFGFWLYLGGRQAPKKLLWGVGIAMWFGLYATYSRAPWIVAAFILVVYMLIAPAGRRSLLRASAALAVLAVPFFMSSLGARIINMLPFIGTSDQGNVDYREQVATISWQLIKQNPFFGNPFALRYMGELRQGQGIIDLVNTYASVSVFYGLVGCTLFVGCLVYPLLRSLLVVYKASAVDADGANLGAVLVASALGSLLMMATASFGLGFEVLTWALAGLCSGYTAAMCATESQSVSPVVGAHVRAAAELHPSR